MEWQSCRATRSAIRPLTSRAIARTHGRPAAADGLAASVARRFARFSSWGHIAALFCYVPGWRLELTGWLLGQAVEWLELADITHVMFDAPAAFPAQTHQLLGLGFKPLTTLQGYVLT